MMNQPKPSKRLDFQGIRACAIIVVLGFHFFPKYCPNGYLGVDQFFVLSGFLMCMLLKRAENQAACSLVTIFYSKRFKRILPLYLLVILVSMMFLYNYFPVTAIESNQSSAEHALLFVSNRPKTDQEDYFLMLNTGIDIFTHTWSLSVEIQFYFLVPFIFLLASRLPRNIQYGYYILMGLLSILFSYTSSEIVSFNSVFARIWQFLIGMLVYLLGVPITQHSGKAEYQVLKVEEGEKDIEDLKLLLEDADDELEDDEEEVGIVISNESAAVSLRFSGIFSYLLLCFLLVTTAFPFVLPADVVRPAVTIGTGLLMLISEDNWILSNKILTYIGDISFSLYLIHWPIYAYWKLTCEGNEYLLITALLTSIALAIITFETFEKWYLKLSSTSVGILVVVLFFVNIVTIHKDDIYDHIRTIGRNYSNLDDVTENMTVDDAIYLNHRWSVNDLKNLYDPSCEYESIKTPYGWCRHTGLSRRGKYRIMTFGNSWTANHAKLFYQECGYKAKSILQGAAYGMVTACEPLYLRSSKDKCLGNFTTFVTRITEEKPGIAFHFTRHISIGNGFPKNVTTFDKDSIYQMMKTQLLKFIANIKYKLYLVHAIPSVLPNQLGKVAERLKNGTNRVELVKMILSPHGFELARRRYEQLMKDCNGKCEMIDYLSEFYTNSTKTFRYFDEKGFLYWTAYQHFSPHGIEKIRHIWTDICSKL
ncbi:hypothetical protein CRE_11141 [Caenorhabditis remanei]|uniref:Acyl_transf_3 domain-containing protein n=1 Tax=Caenorhabditis remanei TaxID=31234 RepID=E3M5U0_CAERE|nr:hypothetical protein CRE_11141 [Caenorhabditis remanei]